MTPAQSFKLSARELQLVTLLRRGMANKEIAWELQLTEGTVKEYLFRLFRKVKCRNRTELALRPDIPTIKCP